jgi:hypothetical protein
MSQVTPQKFEALLKDTLGELLDLNGPDLWDSLLRIKGVEMNGSFFQDIVSPCLGKNGVFGWHYVLDVVTSSYAVETHKWHSLSGSPFTDRPGGGSSEVEVEEKGRRFIEVCEDLKRALRAVFPTRAPE